MLSFNGKNIFLACGSTDCRKQINGLLTLVESNSSFTLSPYDAAVFVFCNKKRDRLKIIEFDGGGFWLYMKRLEQGRFIWPGATDDNETMELTNEELSNLLGGPRLEQKLKGKPLGRPALY
jgi:transposase